jgi:DNA repair protein RecO (recombination protein O)
MLYKAKAIVLGGRDIGEADKIMTLYSEEKGKIKAIAKGIRKTKSKFGSSLEPFTFSNLLIYSKNNSVAGKNPLDIISDAQIQSSFRNLRDNLEGFAYGNFLVELVDKMTGEREQDGYRIFRLLKEFLGLGGCVRNAKVLIYGFTLRFFNVLGYHPRIDECVICGSKSEGYYFSVNDGGVLCGDCKKRETGVLPISISSLQYFRQLMRMEPRHLDNLKISVCCEKELENIIQDYLDFYLERDIKSLVFFRQVTEERITLLQ